MKEKKSILFFMNVLRKGAGMINRETAMANELAQRGHNISILSYFKPEEVSLNSNIKLCHIINARYRDILCNNIFFKIIFALKVFLTFYKIKPEYVMVDLPEEAQWANLFKPFFGYKVIFTYHGVADEKFYDGATAVKLQKIRKKCHLQLKKSDQIIVVSDFLKKEVYSALGLVPKRIYNGFEIQENLPAVKNRNKLLFIGRFTEYKGAINIVNSFIKIANQNTDAILELHGYQENKEYLQKIKDLIKINKLHKQIKIFGPVEPENVNSMMAEAGIFINGSTDETFCMPALEAQACGTPCIAFKAGGIPEVVRDRITGLLAEPENIDEMAQNIHTLLNDDITYKRLKLNLKNHVQSFTYPHLANQLMQIFFELNLREELSKMKTVEYKGCVK